MGMTVERAEEERRKVEQAAAEREAARKEREIRWAKYSLPTSFVRHPSMLTDILRSAQKSADVMGVPVRIVLRYEHDQVDVVEPNRPHLEAYGAYHRVPLWVRQEMGWA